MSKSRNIDNVIRIVSKKKLLTDFKEFLELLNEHKNKKGYSNETDKNF